MSRERHSRARRALLAAVRGEVLEIGFGTGLNLPHYPAHVKKIVTVDPNAGMHARARKRIESSPIAVEQRVLGGDALPMADGTFDSVVSTWTLCSIDKVARALQEIRRVLKPDGRLYFLEHGLSDDPAIQRWQRRLTPIQRVIGDGCRLDRDVRALLQEAGFTLLELDNFYMEKEPRTHGYMYRGAAGK